MATGKLAASVEKVSGGGWPNWTIYGPQRSLDCTNNDCDGKCNFWMNLHECSKMLSAFSSMPGFQNPPRSLTNQWSKFARHEIILFPNSCTEVNLVTQLDHSWAKICPTYVQYNTHGIFFTKKIFKPLFHSLSHVVIVFSKSCKGQSRLKPIEKNWQELNGASTIICWDSSSVKIYL